MSKILVTGGCGYIGSHTVVDLLDNGFEVLSVDNLSRGTEKYLDGVEKITGKRVKNYKVDLTDLDSLSKVFEDHENLEGIIHFAAFKTVPESVNFPLLYYHNNLDSLLNILKCVQQYGIANFVFSSSCSVYGNIEQLPVTEDAPLPEAESPYASTKQMGEKIIRDFETAHPEVKSILLRYFNPVGAHESALIGEYAVDKPENLVPIITQTAIGKRDKMSVHGSDYNTRDGSCIRDYIHVMDIANAHTKALQYLLDGKNETNCEVFNLGTGEGVSVLEAIKAFEKVSGVKLKYELGPRRPGDVEAIYADNTKAKNQLGWKPTRSLEDMMRSAWEWEKVLAED